MSIWGVTYFFLFILSTPLLRSVNLREAHILLLFLCHSNNTCPCCCWMFFIIALVNFTTITRAERSSSITCILPCSSLQPTTCHQYFCLSFFSFLICLAIFSCPYLHFSCSCSFSLRQCYTVTAPFSSRKYVIAYYLQIVSNAMLIFDI